MVGWYGTSARSGTDPPLKCYLHSLRAKSYSSPTDKEDSTSRDKTSRLLVFSDYAFSGKHGHVLWRVGTRML